MRARRMTAGMVVALILGVPAARCVAQWDPRSLAAAGMRGATDTVLLVGGGNPAAHSMRSGVVVSASYIPGVFELRELQRFGVAASAVYREWGGAVHFTHYGRALFSRSGATLSLSRRLGEGTAAGLSVGGSIWQAHGYESYFDGHSGIGLMMAGEGYTAGVCADVAVSRDEPPLPELTAGVRAEVGSLGELTIECRQTAGVPMGVRYAIHAFLAEAASVMIGWQDDPHMIGGGIVLTVMSMQISYGGEWHAVLGWTHGMGISVTP